MPDLGGVSVVVTRAPHQSRELTDLITAAGGEVVLFPVTQITPLPDNDAGVTEGLQQLEQSDIAIFVSPNAATFGLDLLARSGLILPSHTKVLAVGPGTASQLGEKGISVDAIPQGRYDSEALLGLPVLQDVHGLKTLIIRGLAGRETLAQVLTQRGATVAHLPCYRRTQTDQVDGKVLARWRQNEFSAVVLTSVSGVDHLWSILGVEVDDFLAQTALIVSGERIATRCRSLGFTGTIAVAENAGMPALLEALRCWRENQPA